MADTLNNAPTGDIKIFIDKFNSELDKAIKDLDTISSNLKNIYSDAIKITTPRTGSWPKDENVKTIGDLFKYTFPDISTNTFIKPPTYLISNGVSSYIDESKKQDYISWEKDFNTTPVIKEMFKKIETGLNLNIKLEKYNNIKKPGVTNPNLYSVGQHWFDIFMKKVLEPSGPIFGKGSMVDQFSKEKGLTSSISLFTSEELPTVIEFGSEESKKIGYSDFIEYVIPKVDSEVTNLSGVNIQLQDTSSNGEFSGLRTQYKSGLFLELIKDKTFNENRGIKVDASNQNIWNKPIGEFIGDYEQILLYKAFIQAGDNYKSVVLPYSDEKVRELITSDVSAKPTSVRPDTQEYTFNVEKKDTFIVVGGTVSPPLELVIVPNDGTAYIFDKNPNTDEDLDEEYIESDFDGSEELAIELEVRGFLQSKIDPNLPDQSGKIPPNTVSDVDFTNPKYTGVAWKAYDINKLVDEIGKTKYKPNSIFKDSLKKILLWMKTDDLIKDPRDAAYLLGTAFGESGYSLQRWESDYICTGTGIPYGSSGPCSAALNYYKSVKKNKFGKIVKVNYYTLGTDSKGFPYFGRGLIQLTGKGNYELYGKKLGINLIENGDLAIQENNSYKIAAIFLSSNTFSKVKRGDLERARQSVNGGTNKIEEVNGAYSTWLGIIDKAVV
jgi:hypothetical protein